MDVAGKVVADVVVAAAVVVVVVVELDHNNGYIDSGSDYNFVQQGEISAERIEYSVVVVQDIDYPVRLAHQVLLYMPKRDVF